MALASFGGIASTTASNLPGQSRLGATSEQVLAMQQTQSVPVQLGAGSRALCVPADGRDAPLRALGLQRAYARVAHGLGRRLPGAQGRGGVRKASEVRRLVKTSIGALINYTIYVSMLSSV